MYTILMPLMSPNSVLEHARKDLRLNSGNPRQKITTWERRGRHSHAERGNECFDSSVPINRTRQPIVKEDHLVEFEI